MSCCTNTGNTCGCRPQENEQPAGNRLARMLTEEELADCSSRYMETNVDPQRVQRKFCEVNAIPLGGVCGAPEPSDDMVNAALEEALKEERTRIGKPSMYAALKAALAVGARAAGGAQG